LGQLFASAVALSLTLLIAGAFGLGLGIHHGAIRSPNLDISFSEIHIVSYATNQIECRLYQPCHSSSRYYYVLWVFRETAPNYMHETWHRILTVPL
jgi:hypothetical protein